MSAALKQNCLALAVGLQVLAQANALIISGTGPAIGIGWPSGAGAVAYLTSSIGWWEGPPFGGGEWHILFRGDTEAFMQALTNFAAIHTPALDLVIHDGPKQDQFLKRDDKSDNDTRVDWEFVVWNPESWNHLYNNTNVNFTAESPNFRKPVAAPRLDVYIGGGRVDWTKIKIPAGLRVRDERATAASSTKAALSSKHELVVTNYTTGNRP